jgi:hypothetical protein
VGASDETAPLEAPREQVGHRLHRVAVGIELSQSQPVRVRGTPGLQVDVRIPHSPRPRACAGELHDGQEGLTEHPQATRGRGSKRTHSIRREQADTNRAVTQLGRASSPLITLGTPPAGRQRPHPGSKPPNSGGPTSHCRYEQRIYRHARKLLALAPYMPELAHVFVVAACSKHGDL